MVHLHLSVCFWFLFSLLFVSISNFLYVNWHRMGMHLVEIVMILTGILKMSWKLQVMVYLLVPVWQLMMGKLLQAQRRYILEILILVSALNHKPSSWITTKEIEDGIFFCATAVHRGDIMFVIIKEVFGYSVLWPIECHPILEFFNWATLLLINDVNTDILCTQSAWDEVAIYNLMFVIMKEVIGCSVLYTIWMLIDSWVF